MRYKNSEKKEKEIKQKDYRIRESEKSVKLRDI